MVGVFVLCGGVWAQESAVDRFPSQLQIEMLEDGFGASSDRPSGELNALTMSLVKHFEGWIPAAYDDPADYCTIGYGHLIALKKCADINLGQFATPLTEAQGEDLLRKDLGWAQVAVEELVRVDLNDDQYGALSSFVFNVGKTNFASSTLLKMLNRGEYDDASLQFARWVRAGGEVMPGLVIRRSCEATLFDGGLALGPSGRFDRSKCVSQGAASDVGELIDIELGEEE
ncbi:lysozyme [Devosia sp.]|uniref:lysozyme n=1 Tax=Devosia sp. TaxID=1871048 RepID=UPI001B1E1CD0|nr:lysozyme [Devosia sp.]MBO9588525.1 lysozyme [Devosia sp.]